MNDFVSLARDRRSIREFGPHPVEFEKVMQIIRAASYAPSVGDLQPWNFIIITDDGTKEALIQNCPQQDWMYSAPLLLVITSDVGKTSDYYGDYADRWCSQTCAAAVQNMLLAATDLGLGACWVGSFDSENFRDILKIPDGFRPEACVALGYSNEVPGEKQIRPLDHNTFFNAFGGKLESPHSWLHDWGEHFREKQRKTVKEYKKRNPDIGKEFGGKVKGHAQNLMEKAKGLFKQPPKDADQQKR